MNKVLFLYDYTGIMAQPWLDAGYECWCVDSQHPEGITREGNLVKVGMFMSNTDDCVEWFKNNLQDVKFVFGFPPCTDLAVSGAAWFEKKKKANPGYRKQAMDLVYVVKRLGEFFDVPWALENPISVISSEWRKPDYMFHPWEYSGYLPKNDEHPMYPEYIAPRDMYPKKTCIWSGNGFKMPTKKFDSKPEKGYSTQHLKLGGKSLKTKNIRSATPRGFAKAVFTANGGQQ